MRYVRLWLSFFRASWMSDIEYRTNIVVRVLGEVVWYIVQLSVFEVLYTHANAINGWDVHAMRVFMGTLFLVDNIFMFFFMENMDSLNTVVRKGDLDMYLTKPVNSQFMVSMRKVGPVYLINLFIILFYLSWAITGLPQMPGVLQFFAYALSVLAGVDCYYALRFLFATLVIILQDAGNVQFIWHQLFRLATRPDRIYPNPLRFLVLVVFPVGFMASVPARVLVEGPSLSLIIAAPCVSAFLIYLSHLGWHGALKRYSSASS